MTAAGCDYWTMAQLDAQPRQAQYIRHGGKNPRSIAIVDDDPSVLKALARLLGTRSFATKTYLSAPQFLASLAEGLPDCLIADLQMPEMTGLELQLTLARQGVQIPIIIITAHDEAGMRERCRSGRRHRLPGKAGQRHVAVRGHRCCQQMIRRLAGLQRMPLGRQAASMESIGRIHRGSSRWGTPAAQSSGRRTEVKTIRAAERRHHLERRRRRRINIEWLLRTQ